MIIYICLYVCVCVCVCKWSKIITSLLLTIYMVIFASRRGIFSRSTPYRPKRSWKNSERMLSRHHP